MLQIDRVLDVDDVFTAQWNPTTIDWMKALPPPLTATTTDAAAAADADAGDVAVVAVEEGDEEGMKVEAGDNESSSSTDTSFASPTPSQSQSPCEEGKSKKTRRTKKQKVEADVPTTSTDTALDEAEWEEDQPAVKADSPKRSPRTKGAKPTVKPTKKATATPPETQYLHSTDSCWMTIKWESLRYSEFTVESVEDVRKAGIDYLWALRDFYRCVIA